MNGKGIKQHKNNFLYCNIFHNFDIKAMKCLKTIIIKNNIQKSKYQFSVGDYIEDEDNNIMIVIKDCFMAYSLSQQELFKIEDENFNKYKHFYGNLKLEN